MTALTSLTITDGEATNHTFVPYGIQDGVATLVESDGSPIGDNKITLSKRRTASGVYKPRITVAMPVVFNEIKNGVTRSVVERTAYVNVEFSFADASDLEERNNLRELLIAALSDETMIKPMVSDLESIY